MYNTLYFVKLKHKSDTLQNKSKAKFSDAGIQDVSTRISIKVRTQKNINDLTERYEPDDDDDDDDESDKHLQARDRRYSCLKTFKTLGQFEITAIFDFLSLQ